MNNSDCADVTVVIPNFNDSEYITYCIDSIISQSIRPKEVVIIDDGSTDNSVSVIRSLISGRDGFELILNKENKGVYGAIKVGLERSSCKYVLCLSANDLILPELISTFHHDVSKNPQAGIWSAMGYFVEDNRYKGLVPQAVVSTRTVFMNPIECGHFARSIGSWFLGCTIIYRRGLLREMGWFDPKYYGLADMLAAMALACKAGAIFSPTPLAGFRIHSGSFLKATLNPEKLSGILTRLDAEGPRMFESLRETNFIRRNRRRLIFSAIRSQGGSGMKEYSILALSIHGVLLRLVDRFVSPSLTALRLALCFLILRPEDTLSSVWYRYIGMKRIALLEYNRKRDRRLVAPLSRPEAH